MATYDFDFAKNTALLRPLRRDTNTIVSLYQAQNYEDELIHLRKGEEKLVNYVYQIENIDLSLFPHGWSQATLGDKLNHLREMKLFPYKIMDLFYDIKHLGNAAVHSGGKFTQDQGQQGLAAWHDLLVFLVNTYSGGHLRYAKAAIEEEYINNQATWYAPRENKLKTNKGAQTQAKLDKASSVWNGNTMTIIKWIAIVVLLILIGRYLLR